MWTQQANETTSVRASTADGTPVADESEGHVGRFEVRRVPQE